MSSLAHKLKVAPRVAWSQLCMYRKWLLFKIAKNWVILNRISPRLRPWLWKRTGVKIQGKVSIGYDVYYDVGNASLITIEDGAWIASQCLLLCHKRVLTDYHVGDDYNRLPYQKHEIVLKKGCCIGMRTVIMPGVTIGEGAIVGVGSLVTKDIPAWTIAVGNPAKVVRNITENEKKVKTDEISC